MAKRAARDELGSFSEEEARAIAEVLGRVESISATVRRLMVGARNDEPTEWWIVEIPARSALSAGAWLRGWKAGRTHARIEDRRTYHGGTYADAAHALGYLEIMPERGES